MRSRGYGRFRYSLSTEKSRRILFRGLVPGRRARAKVSPAVRIQAASLVGRLIGLDSQDPAAGSPIARPEVLSHRGIARAVASYSKLGRAGPKLQIRSGIFGAIGVLVRGRGSFSLTPHLNAPLPSTASTGEGRGTGSG